MLDLYTNGTRRLSIAGSWLYPLFALYFAADRSALSRYFGDVDIVLHDPKIGRAAVFLYSVLGVTKAYGETVSSLAITTAEKLRITLVPERVVDSLHCRTEALLRDTDDVANGCTLIEERIAERFFVAPASFVSLMAHDETTDLTFVHDYVTQPDSP